MNNNSSYTDGNPAPRWDAEVLVLRGDDRDDLLRRVAALADFTRRQPDVSLADLAFSLAQSLAPGGCRLALVVPDRSPGRAPSGPSSEPGCLPGEATSTLERLHQQLERAAQKLADPACNQIKDAAGIYFTDEPLHVPGSIGVLFPGEGAQYLNMLGDLPAHFPEVRECFEAGDAFVAADDPTAPPLSRFTSFPADASRKERDEAEAELRRLSNAIYAVLMADFAMQRVLETLRLPIDVVGGHSAGELAALWAAECMGENGGLATVRATMLLLENREEANSSPGGVLLAVGASREVAADILRCAGIPCAGNGESGCLPWEATCNSSENSGEERPAAAFVAMDNCPHQSILVGLPEAMAAVEREVAGRNLIYERLLLERPYHTPLFEPMMGPLRSMFDAVTFSVPRRTVYSATTGDPFSADPDEIRELALAHWARPVEFTRMIRNMYDSGVRIFVESGPRGNLTAFVEDILRGRPFLAVAADVPRRSGTAQLCHMAGQLLVHHVPMQLDAFFRGRSVERIDWESNQETPSEIASPRSAVNLVDCQGRFQRAAPLPDAKAQSSQSDSEPTPAANLRPTASQSPEEIRPAATGVFDVSQAAAATESINVPVATSESAHPESSRLAHAAPSEDRFAASEVIAASELIGAPEAIGAPERSEGRRSRAAVLGEYWNVMDQFLQTQQQVMQQYLHGRGARGQRRGSAAGGFPPPLDTAVIADERPCGEPEFPQPGFSDEGPQTNADSLPMIGEIVEHQRGRRIVQRRRLDRQEDLYADEHTVGGRDISHVDPEQRGLPVMPMTFTLEMMAETAALLLPGKVVLGLKNVQLSRWLAFYDDPSTIEVTARMLDPNAQDTTTGTGPVEVLVEVRDLGNAENSPGEKRWVAAVGTVMLDDAFPDAPVADEFQLTDARPCEVTLDVLYNNLFHGPIFQGVESLDRRGVEGITAHVRVGSHEGVFASNRSPAFLADPVFLDVAMHPMAGWHLAFDDQSGRLLLPFGLDRIEFFGPRPPAGQPMEARGRITEQSTRHFVHSFEAVDPAGRIWCRFTGVKLWRFYLPFHDVNFHGPKNVYFLSDPWPLALPLAAAADRDAPPVVDSPGKQPGSLGAPAVCCVRMAPIDDLVQPALQTAAARVTLSPKEQAAFKALTRPDDKKAEWLFGRFAAKDAMRMLMRQMTGERPFMADIEIESDQRGRPIASPRGTLRPDDYPNVSIAHTAGLVAAIAADAPHVGIDVERVVPRDAGFLKIAFSEDERRMLDMHGDDHDEAIARFWCAKEAVGKALGCGLGGAPQNLAVVYEQPPPGKVDERVGPERAADDPPSGRVDVRLGPELAAELPDWADTDLIVTTRRDGPYVVATTLCERAGR